MGFCSKDSNLPQRERGLVFARSFWDVISKALGMSCLIGMFLFVQALESLQIVQQCDWGWGWDWSNRVSVRPWRLEMETRHMGSSPCPGGRARGRALDAGAWVPGPVGSTLSAESHIVTGKRGTAPTSLGRDDWKLCAWKPPGFCPVHPFLGLTAVLHFHRL